MILHHAVAEWQKRQAHAISQAYDRAYRDGQQNYRRDNTNPAPHTATGQPPPAVPPAQPKLQALSPALNSLARMGAEMALLVPTTAQIATAGSVAAATVALLQAYLARNAYRLAGAASVAWAGEQHGYVQAADADGLLLEWELDAGAHHCDDCPALAGLPPMPLAQWPTLPGDGATQCAAGCKCSMRAVSAPRPVLTADQHQALQRVAARHAPPVLVPA